MRFRASLVAVLLIGVVGTVMGTALARGGDRNARLTGAIHWKGGGNRNEPGRVTVRNRQGKVVAAKTLSPGNQYHFHVVPGRYHLRAQSGTMKCFSATVTARAGQTTRKNLFCRT